MEMFDLLALTGLESTRHLPRAAHDGTGCIPADLFAALVGKPGQKVNPTHYVFLWRGIADYLRSIDPRGQGITDRQVRRQVRCGSLSWVPTVNGLPSAHVNSLNSYYADLVDARHDQRVGNLRQFRTNPTSGNNT